MSATAPDRCEETNAEVVGRMLAAFNEGDDATVVDLVHPDVEFLALVVRVGLASKPYSGPEGVRRYLRDVRAAWPEISVEIESAREVGSTVVTLGRLRGRSVGGSLEIPTTWVSTVRDGLVTHGLVLSEEPELAQVLGLGPDGPPRIAPAFRLEVPAAPESIPRARASLSEWASSIAPSDSELHALELVVTEGVTNAVLHAYTEGVSGAVRIRAEARYDGVLLAIGDDGTGMRPRPDSSGLGLGLPLIGMLTESLTIKDAPERAGGCELQVMVGVDTLKRRL
jgi:serine/threonine-protein kinase RsbW